MNSSILLIFSVSGLTAIVTFWAMHTTPGKGLLQLAERLCTGAFLCWLFSLILSPFGLRIAQSPLTALSAGYLGLPGVALAAFLTHWP